MSLIQEALRRQQEEQRATADGPQPVPPAPPPPPPPPTPAKPTAEPPAPAPAPEQPPAPPPLPPLASPPTKSLRAAQDQTAPKPVRVWRTLLVVGLVLLILAGAAVAALFYVFQRLRSDTQAVFDRAPTIAAGADTAARTGEDTAADAAAGAAAGTGTVTDAPPPPPRAEAPAPARDRAPVEWPHLTLSGLVGRGRTGSAILNNEVVGVGESIQDVTLLGIDSEGVELEYRGERRHLKVAGVIDD